MHDKQICTLLITRWILVTGVTLQPMGYCIEYCNIILDLKTMKNHIYRKKTILSEV